MGNGVKSDVVNSALTFANANQVLGGTAVYTDSTVTCGSWDQSTQTYTRNTTSSECLASSDNAVQVTRTAGERPIFAAMLNHSANSVGTSATAWVANVTSGSACLKPLGVDYKLLITALNALRTPPSTDLYRPLDDTDLSLIRTRPNDLKFCMKDGSAGSANGNGGGSGGGGGNTCPNTGQPPGNFGPIGLVPGDGGGNNYTAELGADCSTQTVISIGDNVDVITGNMVGPTNAGVQNYCQTRTPCIMSFPLYNGTIFASGANATDGNRCTGSTSGTGVCHTVITIGAGVVDYPQLPGTPNGVITGHFTIASVGGAVVGGTTKGLLTKILLVQ
jgi:hypothetical protein